MRGGVANQLVALLDSHRHLPDLGRWSAPCVRTGLTGAIHHAAQTEQRNHRHKGKQQGKETLHTMTSLLRVPEPTYADSRNAQMNAG